MQRFQGTTQDGTPVINWAAVQKAASLLQEFEVWVMSREASISERQRNWYKGVCLRQLADETGDSVLHWDFQFKGLNPEIFKNEIVTVDGRSVLLMDSISHKTRKQMTQFIENILAFAMNHRLPVFPPDPDLRK